MTDFDSPRFHRFAARYDRMTELVEQRWLGARRAGLLGGLTGTVLEIGAGTGANLPYYRAADRVIATEPSPAMRQRMQVRLAQAAVPVDIVPATADDLPVIDHSIDAVVSTLVLCSVDDLPAVLAELRRVLVPGGRLAFVEHIRGGTVRGRIQDLATPLWRHFGGGCRPNRAIVDAIRAAGFAIDDVEIFKPSPNVFVTSPLAQGVATLAR